VYGYIVDYRGWSHDATFTLECPATRLAVDMDIHGYIHGYYAGTTL